MRWRFWRLNEIDAELEILAQRIITLDGPQQPVIFIHTYGSCRDVTVRPDRTPDRT